MSFSYDILCFQRYFSLLEISTFLASNHERWLKHKMGINITLIQNMLQIYIVSHWTAKLVTFFCLFPLGFTYAYPLLLLRLFLEFLCFFLPLKVIYPSALATSH